MWVGHRGDRRTTMPLIALVALSIGIKAKNTMIGGVGAVILVTLLTQSG
ncbi:hypothetical protein GCM10022384_60220 [Streptomyces marokkonensis]|uniref:Uncharacterized protein n=1 Tax=Streptomyces marokkonensis TaxID=324855 RepID=A0ABP7S2T3_9ACTN